MLHIYSTFALGAIFSAQVLATPLLERDLLAPVATTAAASTATALPTVSSVHTLTRTVYWAKPQYTLSASWAKQSALYSQPAPSTATLVPTLHWTQNGTSFDSVVPNTESTVYYAGDGDKVDARSQHQMAWVDSKYTTPVVAMDQGSAFFDYEFSNSSSAASNGTTTTLNVTFSSVDAFYKAKSAWAGVVPGLILIGGKAGICSGQQPGESCYFKVASLQFDDGRLHVIASGSRVNLNDILDTVDVEWGTYIPRTPINPNASLLNSTSSTNATTTVGTVNCTAPADSKYGLPVTCLGPYFDQSLDAAYGTEQVSGDFAAFIASIPNLISPEAAVDPNDEDTKTTVAKRQQLRESDNQETDDSSVPAGFAATIKRQYDITVPASNQSREVIESPWGNQILLKSYEQSSKNASAKIDIFCVDCGVLGQVTLGGRLSVSVVGGVQTLSTSLNGDFSVSAKLGIDANGVAYKQSFDEQLFQVGLTGLCIPGILCADSYVKLGVNATLESSSASDSAQLLAGGLVSFQNANASIDMIAVHQGSASGWQPEFLPTIQATKATSISSSFTAPVAFAVSLSILKGKFTREIAIVQKSSYEAPVAASAGAKNETCAGASTALSMKSKVWAEVPDIGNFVLADAAVARTVAQDCDASSSTAIRLAIRQTSASPTSTATATSTSSTGTATATGVIDVTDTRISNAINETTAFSLPQTNSSSYKTADNLIITPLVSSSNKDLSIRTCNDGNIYVFSAATDNTSTEYPSCLSTWTQSTSNDAVNIVADGAGRILHFYPDEMSKTGVSRLRVSDVESVPLGVTGVYLAANSTGEATEDAEEEEAFSILDMQKNKYYPVVCTFKEEGASAKVFLVEEPESGMQVLTGTDVTYSITGGEVDQCRELDIAAAS